VSLSLDLRTTRAEVGRATDAAREWAAREGLPGPLTHDLALVLDELLANVMWHGYEGDPAGWVAIEVTREGEAVHVLLRDRAPAFDPLQTAPVDDAVPFDARPVGGLGVHLVRFLADEVRYARVEDENQLRVVLRPRSAGEPGAAP
jgi:serine/threonine-protein kinase RsbW